MIAINQNTIYILLALLRSAIYGTKLTEEERNDFSPDLLQDLLKISSKHDVAHLVVLGLKQNGLLSKEDKGIETYILKAAYRYERMNYEYGNLCKALEKAHISFLPLKGAVIRRYYPEAWMRTSCDIDILIHQEDIEKAISYLMVNLNYSEGERATHDISLYSPGGIHVELHFDLVEEGRANNAINVLRSVWDNVVLHENSQCWYEMRDEFFYFYHIAHMAKHFETGGCGIRPFIDLWILDHMEGVNKGERDALLAKGDLLKFANSTRALSEVWFGYREIDEVSSQMQNFLLHGGAFGSTDNRVAIQQKKKGGKVGYLISRIFISYTKLKRYYPILEKHRWLMPFFQIRRWFMLLNPAVAGMAKRELKTNMIIDESKANEMYVFLENVGL